MGPTEVRRSCLLNSYKKIKIHPNKPPIIFSTANRMTTTTRLTGKPADRQAGRQIGRQTGRQTGSYGFFQLKQAGVRRGEELNFTPVALGSS